MLRRECRCVEEFMNLIPQPSESHITSACSVKLSESVDGWMEAVRNYRWNRYNTVASV